MHKFLSPCVSTKMKIANLVAIDMSVRLRASVCVCQCVRVCFLVCVCHKHSLSCLCLSRSLSLSLTDFVCVCVCVFREQRKMWPNKSSDQKQLLFVVSRGELRCIDLSSLSVHSKGILPIFGGFE